MIEYFGVDFENWLGGFKDQKMSITKSVEIIKNHPLVPSGIKVYGYVMDSYSGKMTKIV